MSVVFFEGKNIPAGLRQMNGYGDGADAAASMVNSLTTGAVGIAKAVSPWDLLTGIFVAKPIAETQAAAMAQQAQIAAAEAQQEDRARTIRTVMYVGAGLVGVVVLAVAMRPPRSKSTSGYRRKRSRR